MKKHILYSLLFIGTIGSIWAQKGINDHFSTTQTSASSLADVQVSLYPNPTTDNNFAIKSDNAILKVEVLNIIGNMVYKSDGIEPETKEYKVSLLNAEKGIYIVKVSFEGNKAIVKKLLVK